jgi:hypothetical protein
MRESGGARKSGGVAPTTERNRILWVQIQNSNGGIVFCLRGSMNDGKSASPTPLQPKG